MPTETLQEHLSLIVSLGEQIDDAEQLLRNLKKRRDAVKAAAVQAIEESKLDRVTACGRSWRVEYDHHLSVPADKRDAALAAAAQMGLDADTMLSINTSRLKSLLKELAGGKRSSWTEGTPLEGVVQEYVAPALYAVAAGKRPAKEE